MFFKLWKVNGVIGGVMATLRTQRPDSTTWNINGVIGGVMATLNTEA